MKASKAASDIMAQEYGRYFGLKIGILRGGCLTGPLHAGAELHGFLSYLIRAGMSDLEYQVYGYKAKQVRDQLHSFDVVTAIYEFYKNPRSGEVYNLGGGRQNNVSILEAIQKFEKITGREFRWSYAEEPREGDHICYISNMSKFRAQYPEWKITKTLDDIFHEILEAPCKTPLSQKKP
jgi:CDP-paratose 2-epimerase